MAITGSGTEQDPWIVHSYDELQSVVSSLSGTDRYYINLGNDINCNDYGTDFVWHSVSVNNNNRNYTFDLCNHTIKNVIIANGETMFIFGGQSGTYIKNGKILNLFMASSNGFDTYSGGVYNPAKLENVSISTDITAINRTAYAFNCSFENCAVYIQGGITNSNAAVIKVDPNNTMHIKNTDIMLNDVHGYYFFMGLRPNASFTDSRLRGKFTGHVNSAAWNDGANACIINSVFDVEVNKTNLLTDSGANTGVINNDKLPAGSDARGLTKVTSEEIVNGAALRAKGFSVVNVVS